MTDYFFNVERLAEQEAELARLRDALWTRGEEVVAIRNELAEKVGAQQAHIDRLMIEFCPEEMTPEQRENWARHQVRVAGHDVAHWRRVAGVE